MEHFFVSVYDYFHKRPRVLYAVFFVLIALSGWFASRIEIRENVSDIFPDNKKGGQVNQMLQSKALEKLIVMVSFHDTTRVDPDSLLVLADSLVTKIQSRTSGYIRELNFRVDDERTFEVFNTISAHLPVFLTEEDYQQLDSMLRPEPLAQRIHENYRQLVSPSGMITKRIYAKDILGISQLGLAKIQQLQYDDNYALYDNAIFTRDKKHVLIFISPEYPASDTGHNIRLIEALDDAIHELHAQYASVDAVYFGGTAVAVGNARQLRKDTILTLTLTIVLLGAFVIWFFKKKRAPLVVLVPVGFGALFSMAGISLLQGNISVIALASGSIILGIAVNYSLHFIVHIQHAGNTRDTIKDLSRPMTLGSTTTVLAFLGLQFANAGVLRDIGLFAALSLIGAAVCTLIFLPHFFKHNLFQKNVKAEKHLGKFLAFDPSAKKRLVWGIIFITPVFFYFAGDVKFNSDMNRLNFLAPELDQAQQKLNVISEFSLQSAYIVISGDNTQKALQASERVHPILRTSEKQGIADKYVSVSSLLVSDSLQRIRLAKWKAYWNDSRKAAAEAVLRQEGQKLNFSPVVYDRFADFVGQEYALMDAQAFEAIKRTFFTDYISETKNGTTIITPVKVEPARKEKFYETIDRVPSADVVDRKTITNNFIENVNDDFTFIVTFTSILVFVSLLVAYGRIELALITFFPMFITWIWILGIMALFDIEFNIVNVMISTFIFGLGDDYSIFTMDGLQQEYKTGRKVLSSVRVSILISALTTICGLGVLIFAKHPALQSIAFISIIGIGCVFVMSQTIEPFFFRALISARAKRKLTPLTAWGLCKTVIAFSYFVFGSLVLSLIGFIFLKLNPFPKKYIRKAYHGLLRMFTWTLVYMMGNLKKRIINRESVFNKPAVIIANHASFLDILVTTMLSPNLILLTNKWVWNSPVFGLVVRFAEYYPVTEGADESIERLRKKVSEGFSIVVFPEGTRSVDGKIGRFHKGAFFIAEKLNLDIVPLLIHGTSSTIEKGDFYLNDAIMTLKFLPAITPDDERFGGTYSERTKKISRYFKQEFAQLSVETETPGYFRYRLLSNYVYKGPVLEWYARVKLSLENNYAVFNDLVPVNATVLDLGCGYGFLSHMLSFTSSERKITGVDYDEDKILTATHCYSKSDAVNFVCSDITAFAFDRYDVIILSDVLHYLAPQQQLNVLQKCFASINPGGKIIIRDANAELEKRHGGSVLTEIFSTRILRFNKTVQKLSYLRAETILNEAARYNLTVETRDTTRFTSNVIFVIK